MALRPLLDFKKQNVQIDENNQEDNQETQENKQLTAEEAVDSWKQEYARKLGWTSKEEWEQAGRDPEMWRDHNMFLDTSPGYFERLRKKNREYKTSMERNAAAAAATIEETNRKAREEAIREAREAAQANDPDRAAAAAERAAAAQPHPETQAWLAKNTWFNTDLDAQALAAAAVNRAEKQGLSIREQLKAAEEAVKKRFPEHFSDEEDLDELPDFITRQTRKTEQQEPPKREVRMSESSRVASAAAGAQSARVKTPSQNKEKSFNDLPAETKALYEKHFARKFAGHYKTPDEAREVYARRYFANLKDQ